MIDMVMVSLAIITRPVCLRNGGQVYYDQRDRNGICLLPKEKAIKLGIQIQSWQEYHDATQIRRQRQGARK